MKPFDTGKTTIVNTNNNKKA